MTPPVIARWIALRTIIAAMAELLAQYEDA
jgi:hypothetical protein